MRPAPEISTIRSSGFRAVAVVVLSITLLLSPALEGSAAARPKADRPATTAVAKAVTSTSQPPAGRAATPRSGALPLVLAAILLLALLDPPFGFHSHRHWHRH
jgi:hypothetical protein